MTRLIDADALSEKLCETTIFIKDGEVFQRMINDAPTIKPDGDTISRQAAILAITGEPPEAHYPSWYAERIKALPSVQADGDLISRHDAIEYFFRPYSNEELYSNIDIEKALKSLPSAQPTRDLISRQAVLSLFPNSFYGGLAEQIKRLPSAPDSRQCGEWQKEIKGNGWNEWAVLTCDQCGVVIENPTFETNYCPNCGADMRGGEE